MFLIFCLAQIYQWGEANYKTHFSVYCNTNQQHYKTQVWLYEILSPKSKSLTSNYVPFKIFKRIIFSHCLWINLITFKRKNDQECLVLFLWHGYNYSKPCNTNTNLISGFRKDIKLLQEEKGWNLSGYLSLLGFCQVESKVTRLRTQVWLHISHK